MVAPARKSKQNNPVVYTAGVDPTVAYPLHQFLEVSNISRAKIWRLHEKAREHGITLIRDTGTPTVVGKDYIDLCALCGESECKPRGPGRPRKKKTPDASVA